MNEIINRILRDRIDNTIFLYKNSNLFLSENIKRNANWLSPRLSMNIERYLKVSFDRRSESDVFHSSYYRIPDNFKGTVITTVHDFTYEKYVKGIKKSIHSWQKKTAVLNSSKIICISNNTKSDLLYYYPEVDPEKVSVIYNGVSDDFFVCDKATEIDDIKNRYNDFVVYVGGRNGYKNFSTLVDALTNVSSMNLVIVGSQLTDAEVKFLDDKLHQRYFYVGAIPSVELNHIYNSAYCLVYPSLYEGFGIPVIEAMKAGCPVIAANLSSIPEVAGEAAILLDDINSENIANALMTMKNHSLRDALREKGLHNSARFSWERCYQETLELYQ